MEIIENPNKRFRPTAGDAFGDSWTIMWKHFTTLLVVSILYMVITGVTGFGQWQADTFRWFMAPMALFAFLYGIFIAGPISYSVNWLYLKAIRGDEYEIRDMFAVFNKNYWNAVGANVVVSIIIGIGILFFIIPGIVFACRLAFVSYLVMDRDMELSQAIEMSWKMTRGYGVQIFLMGILATLVVLLGFIALFVGIFIAVVWIQAAFATMYQAVVEEEGYFQ